MKNGTRYATLYERLVANTVEAQPGNPQSCWLWTARRGDDGYPRITVREPGREYPTSHRAHRVMLQEVLDADFPQDEAGHLCRVPMCIHPDHLEPQTRPYNLAQRPGQVTRQDACWIPVLYPRRDPLQEAADWAWETRGRVARRCPF